MTPEKLFDYLDGTLPAAEREQLERALVSDSVLQRELAIARQIHKGMPKSSEVIGVAADDPEATARAGEVGRKVATAFAALVLLNVLAGMFFIVHGHNSSPARQVDLGPREAAIRKQLSTSIEQTAVANMPTPTIGTGVINLHAIATEMEPLAQKVIAAATQCGGSATRKFGEKNGVTMIVEVPADKETAFLEAIGGETTSTPSAPNAKTFFEVRIRTQ